MGTNTKVPPKSSSDVFVTQEMLFGVRNELKNDIKSLDKKIESLDKKMESRFAAQDSKFASMDSKFASMDSKLNHLTVLIEEQNARNIIVLDGLKSLFDRQDRVEKALQEQEETLYLMKSVNKSSDN